MVGHDEASEHRWSGAVLQYEALSSVVYDRIYAIPSKLANVFKRLGEEGGRTRIFYMHINQSRLRSLECELGPLWMVKRYGTPKLGIAKSH